MMSRRALLLGSAVATIAVGTGQASAFSMQEYAPQSGIGLAMSSRCGDDDHARLIASLESRLVARHARAGETMTVACPICGCPVAVMVP